MINMKKAWSVGLAATLLLSQGMTVANAKGHSEKSHGNKTQAHDKNKNKIADKWEKKYKLTGKNIASQDKDKDGLPNIVEYQLHLNPLSADTDKNHVNDGLEDADGDKLSNRAEVELRTDPSNPDSDHDKIKDDAEVDKHGVEYSKKVREFELEIETDDDDFEAEYEYKKGHTKIKASKKFISKATVEALVKKFEATTELTEEEMQSIIETELHLEGSYDMEAEVEFLNGKEVEFEKQSLDHDDSQADYDDNQNDEDED
ncbi:hypothetical protein [Rummeliibacillus stabekisii]|uniref:hypothetical protein n=1 Tax=Rummeliibacillus stabekisii TaxID=241244 RepID=UPI0011688E91|nr:hypothetical protein [Rummeliibacillus stabekisii]MBB5170407.1 vacuolar-type H+-ATPase subunit I/STV1 [Rummeliibacillus stabekisii]GEL04665.1 hypothetical protein RST01_12920 [Rummeliibacillus stabekisii]